MQTGATPRRPGEGGFSGSDRFELVSRLGAGGMGVVYEVLDRRNGRHVALKTLELRDASSIYRFKKEFRGLADISHRNLVSLHELVGEGQKWFFTMELIRGPNLIAHLQETSSCVATQATERIEDLACDEVSPPAEGVARAPVNLPALRDAFQQLCQGVHALHLAGKLHRDIKPSNILVDETQRVVLLDFGLATDVADIDELADAAVMGTVAYMSPEQACQKTLGPASDWYSVGVVLFEALTGQLPFTGASLAVLMNKQIQDAPDPREVISDLPEDLCVLCVQLLSREPASRPAELDIIRRLAASSEAQRYQAGVIGSSQGDLFVGRNAELARLADALSLVVRGERPQCVLVDGAPGIGKTALIRHFCQTSGREHKAVMLEGRCYERESVPFKAVDTIIDSLSRFLGRCSVDEVTSLMPTEVQALVRLFPVLRAVPTFARFARGRQALDPQEARRRGLAALRELLCNVAASRVVIVKVDDFQWGDADSATLLTSLLAAPNPPMMLWCISFRREDVDTSLALRTLRQRLANDLAHDLVTTISIERMSEDEVKELVHTRLAMPTAGSAIPEPRLLAKVAAESRGNPFFVEELLRYLQSGHDVSYGQASDSISLPEAILSRLGNLGQGERKLLEAIAVAGAPIPEEVVLTACQSEVDPLRGGLADATTALSVLRAGRLVRSQGVGPRTHIESYHDRIREVIVDSLENPYPQDINHRLASAYALHYPSAYQTIATFFSKASDVEKAAQYAIKAADEAMESLAFERAAFFYRMALVDTHREDLAQRLRVALAEALYNAGMGVEAATAHLEAAKGGSRAVALEQQRLAAESYLRAGHIDEAVETFKQVLLAVNLGFASTSRRSLARLLASRVLLRLRGLGFQQRDASKLSPETLLKIDVCGSCALGFGINDSIRGAEFQTKHLLLALSAGEPNRVGNALSLEAVYRALDGPSARETTQGLIDRARALADELNNPLANALIASAQALLHYQCGEWRSGLNFFDRAAQIYLRECRGHQSAACQAERLATDALFFLGELKEFATRVPAILRAAEDRGDQHGMTDMRTGCPNAAWLVRDQVEQARFECERGEKQWSDRSFFLQHYYAVLAHTNIDLYEGKGASALARCDAMWPSLKRSFLLRVSVVASQAEFLRGRALVLAAAQSTGSEQRALLSRLGKVSKSLSHKRLLAAKPWSQLLAGQAALLRDRPTEARDRIALAHQGFVDAGMALCQQASAGLLGKLLDGSEGAALDDGMIHWMHGQGVVEPIAFASLMAPLIKTM